MSKLLANVRVPAVDEAYDVFIPNDVAVSALIPLLVKGIQEMSGGRYEVSGKEMLMHDTEGVLLDPQKTLGSYMLGDGVRLLLI